MGSILCINNILMLLDPQPQRRSAHVNAYNHWIHSYALGCNGDLKLILFGSDTKNISYYVVSYTTKNQDRTSHMSAMLAEVNEHIRKYTDPGTLVSADQLLVKFVNMTNSHQEIGAPMAIATLMGWAPRIASHKARKIFLADVHWVLRNRIFRQQHPFQ